MSDRARALLARHPLIDGHNDLAYALRDLTFYDLEKYDIGIRQNQTHTDLVRLTEGGVGGQFWSVYVTTEEINPVTVTLEQIDFVRRMVATYPDRLALAWTADDVEQAHRNGQIASLLGAEGGHSIDSSLGALRMFAALGVRYLTLTHNSNVPWADSATDDPVVGGLSDFGRDVVREMNALGMLVDLSHVAATTMRDALATTSVPVIFSHSSARSVCDHPRNVPDDVLAQLPTNGGVCMVTFVPQFVSESARLWDLDLMDQMRARGEDPRNWDAHMAAAKQRARTDPSPPATLSQVADHVERVREVAGVAHVGIGGDFDGCAGLPAGLDDVAGYPNLIEELLGRGWSDAELAALTRENTLRVLRDTVR